ncbi:MAG: hypothetical protein BWY80_00006 [Firmicutes bacterium ADurb.Bin456]|nr:MAG: hypothetical protein BWY80_00006 [Firmicutes bacterium ADurb.Bin456]
MVTRQWAILEEVEKLTEENAADFLSPSVYGQVKIKGKYIRDEHGKLVPVLVKTRLVQTGQTGAIQNIAAQDKKEGTREPVRSGLLNRLQGWFHSLFL